MQVKTAFIGLGILFLCAYLYLSYVGSQKEPDQVDFGHVPEDLKYLLGNWVNEKDNNSVFIFNDGHSFIWYLNKTDYRAGGWNFIDENTVEVSYEESGAARVDNFILDKNNSTIYFKDMPLDIYKKLSGMAN